MRGTAASHKVLSSELGIKGLSCSGHIKVRMASQEQADRAQGNQRQRSRLGTMCANETMLHREPGHTVGARQIQSDS